MKKEMIKLLGLILMCFVTTVAMSQETEEKKSRRQKFKQIIKSGGGFNKPDKDKKIEVGGSEVSFEGNTEWTCTTQKVSMKDGAGGNSGFPLFSPDEAVIYPGSMLQGNSLNSGTPNPIIIERAGGVFSINIYDGNRSSRVEVESVTKSEVTEAINEIIAGSTGMVPSNFNITIKSVESREQLAMELGVDVNSTFVDLEAKLGYKSKSKRSSFMVKLTQNYYSITYDLPTSVDQLFAKSARPADLKPSVGPGNPACYISDVAYGRVFYMLIESNSSKTEMEAEVKAAFNGVATKVKGELKVEKLSQLKDVSYSVFAYGGDSSPTLRAVGVTDMDRLMDMLSQSSTIGSAKPLSFVVRSVENGQIVSTQLATEYNITNCEITGAKGTLPAIAHWTNHPLLKKFGGIVAAYADGPDKFILLNAKGEWLRSTVDVSGNGKLEGPYKWKTPFETITATSKLKGHAGAGLYVFNGAGTKYAVYSSNGNWSQVYHVSAYFGGDCPFNNVGVGALAYGGFNSNSSHSHWSYNHWMFNASGQNYTKGHFRTNKSNHFGTVYNVHNDWSQGRIGDKIDGVGAAIGFMNGDKHTTILFNKAGTEYIVYGKLTGNKAEIIGPFKL